MILLLLSMHRRRSVGCTRPAAVHARTVSLPQKMLVTRLGSFTRHDRPTSLRSAALAAPRR